MTVLFTRDVYKSEVFVSVDVDDILIKRGSTVDDGENYPDDSYLVVEELDMDEWIGLYSDLVTELVMAQEKLAAATERQLLLSKFIKTEIIDQAPMGRPTMSKYLHKDKLERDLELWNLAEKAKDL